jgi:beta-mannosidase
MKALSYLICLGFIISAFGQ